MKLYKKIGKVVAGHVNWDDLCRIAAPNLAERQQLEGELSVHRLCPVRKKYLRQRLGVLTLERDILVEKKERIIGHIEGYLLNHYQFII